MTEYTDSLHLTLPDFNIATWHDQINDNFTVLDAAFRAMTGLITAGVWLNSTAYTVGQNVVDPVSGLIWTVAVAHTSAAAPTTFEQDRIANPTYWVAFTSAAANKGTWTTATPYAINDFVQDGQRFGIVTQAYTSGATYDADVAAGKIVTLIDLSFYTNIPNDGYLYGAEGTNTWKRMPTATPSGEWQFDTTVGGAPAAGFVRYNHATLASVTGIHVNKTDAQTFAQATLINLIVQAGVDLFFGSEKDENKWDVFNVIAAPVDNGTYYIIPVTYKTSGAGGALPAAEYCRLSPIGGVGSKVVTDDTAPVGPLDGQQWWRSSNGKMYVFYDDGTGAGQWVEASGALGTVDGVNLAGYSAMVVANAAQSIPNAFAQTKLTTLGTVDYDPSSFWNAGLQRFQPTRAGLYLVSGKASMTMESGRSMACYVYKNGVIYNHLATTGSPAAATSVGIGGSTLVMMNGSTDYLELFVGHGNSIATNTNFNDRVTAFYIAYLGEAGMPQPTDETALQQNLISIPNMIVSQQNGNVASGADQYYACDEWRIGRATSVGVESFARVSSVTPRKSAHRLRLSVTTIDASLAAGEFMHIIHNIEGSRLSNLGWDGATGVQLVGRFGFRGPAGTYSIAYRNGATDRSYVQNFTVSAAQANTDIEVTFIIPPDTSGGTWPNTTSLGAVLSIVLAAGSTFVAAPNTWQVGSILGGTGISNGWGAIATFELFDVGLYPDPEMTGRCPEWIPPTFVEAHTTAMRYWVSRSVVVETAAAYTTTTLPVSMRVTPTITGGGAGFAVSLGQPDMISYNQTGRASQTLVFNARM